MSMARRKTSQHKRGRRPGSSSGNRATSLRIVGGSLRGSKIAYTGDSLTRPMKDRVREAVFNLIGPCVKDKSAVDLFAGTGALGLEAISRGARQAVMVERHFPSARLIEQNAAALKITEKTEVIAADVFLSYRKLVQDLSGEWLVFCCPPYDLYIDRADDMRTLIVELLGAAPDGSVLVVEADARFDFSCLPHALAWEVRRYPPACIGLFRLPADADSR